MKMMIILPFENSLINFAAEDVNHTHSDGFIAVNDQYCSFMNWWHHHCDAQYSSGILCIHRWHPELVKDNIGNPRMNTVFVSLVSYMMFDFVSWFDFVSCLTFFV